MASTVELKCFCGQLRGSLQVVPSSSFHVHCLCCDCQKYAEVLGAKERILDEHGGSELFQTYPAFLKITQGHEHISCVQLEPKGIYRWYASCCNAPLANTMGKASVPFVGVSVKLMQFAGEDEKRRALGPVCLKAFGKYAVGEAMPVDVHPRFPVSFMPRILWFMLKGALSGKAKPSPFFADGRPVAKVLRAGV
ncbi:hypothetical protein KO507_17890 [Gilvimarinus agarilyticus]|uniref:DUF6151 family protein n=1 Tax=Gilvimarinus sp. 2_MG-2023 TaxID=3062666 RepID=UPI001C08A44A|nr:DUF6151 family protein [Gilvimarinus sp. 2_MG-2023]MBU2887642.1 hypothetical protein [Gilvimarinus agarilyticus]MDO6572293.1 DUF6151 family protein [Gilvimarinus sp. 2_MG-2023]